MIIGVSSWKIQISLFGKANKEFSSNSEDIQMNGILV
jgi:hypothetical protein